MRYGPAWPGAGGNRRRGPGRYTWLRAWPPSRCVGTSVSGASSSATIRPSPRRTPTGCWFTPGFAGQPQMRRALASFRAGIACPHPSWNRHTGRRVFRGSARTSQTEACRFAEGLSPASVACRRQANAVAYDNRPVGPSQIRVGPSLSVVLQADVAVYVILDHWAFSTQAELLRITFSARNRPRSRPRRHRGLRPGSCRYRTRGLPGDGPDRRLVRICSVLLPILTAAIRPCHEEMAAHRWGS